jgi:hypothetical protein
MRSLAALGMLAVLFSVCAAKDEFQPDDFIKHHLNSIGTEQARATVNNRAIEGTVSFEEVNRGSARQDGRQVFVSQGDKLVSLLKLPNPSYHGERFVSDGKKAYIAELRPGVYSNLGQFVMVHPEVLTEGLWGGTLSMGWPLAHLGEHNAKLKDQGLKKVEGRELHRVDYIPKKHSDLDIQLYFEPDTFRHVLTVYSLTINATIGRSEEANSRQQETRYRLEERFADFKTVDGLSLPEKWTIQFTSDVPGPRGGSPSMGNPRTDSLAAGDSTIMAGGLGSANTSVNQFEVTETKITSNVPLDPSNFAVK